MADKIVRVWSRGGSDYVDVLYTDVGNGNYAMSVVSNVKSAVINVSIQAGESESEPFSLANYMGDAGLLFTPAGWTAASIGFKVCSTIDGTYVVLKDEFNISVQILNVHTTIPYGYKLPSALRGATFIKLFSANTSSAAVNQVSTRAITIVAKG